MKLMVSKITFSSLSVSQEIFRLDQESDSGLEVIEEPTLRPSELVRGNNNRSLSMISGKLNNCENSLLRWLLLLPAMNVRL